MGFSLRMKRKDWSKVDSLTIWLTTTILSLHRAEEVGQLGVLLCFEL